jgi:S1-C subfamily serine protease
MKRGLLCWTLCCALLAVTARADESSALVTVPLVPQVQSTVSTGSGFYISHQGHMITAYHVVREREFNWVRHGTPSRLLKATVLMRDAQQDLALLKVDAETTALSFAKWDDVPTGLEAYVLGYPLPNLQGRSIKITQGLINKEAVLQRGRRLFSFSAEVQTGNSGGPVLSPEGLVLGMVQSKLDAMKVVERTRDLPQNVNFAVNAEGLLRFAESAGLQPRVLVPDLSQILRPYVLLRNSKDAVVMVISSEKNMLAQQAVGSKD